MGYFGQAKPTENDVVSLRTIRPSTYLNPQVLVQQTAFVLSERIFSYSPETYRLDAAAIEWASKKETNCFGFTPSVSSLQARIGAGSIPLGYTLSKDLDSSRQRLPKSIIATSSTLSALKPAFEQFIDSYANASPLVAHVATVDYDGSATGALVSNYVSVLTLADDLDLALVADVSAQEIQHMSFFATLLSNITPTLHVYDGLSTSQLKIQVKDVLESAALAKAYRDIQAKLSDSILRRASNDAKASRVLKHLNSALKTSYQPFEYEGDDYPETVLVVLGSGESAAASNAIRKAAEDGVRAGLITVRLYRPFLEDAFLSLIPKSVRRMIVHGQVSSAEEVLDTNVTSVLYSDIVAVTNLSGHWSTETHISDIKYAPGATWDAARLRQLLLAFGKSPAILSNPAPTENVLPRTPNEGLHYEIWDTDKSLLELGPVVQILKSDSLPYSAVYQAFDNTTLGGITKADIYSSSALINVADLYPAVDIAYVGEERILAAFDLLANVRPGGTLILRLPNLKTEDLERRIPGHVRSQILLKGISVIAINAAAITSETDTVELDVSKYALLTASRGIIAPGSNFSRANMHLGLSEDLDAQLSSAIQRLEIPESWKQDEEEPHSVLRRSLCPNSFKQYTEPETATHGLQSLIVASKSMAFREAYETIPVLRPDLTVKTFTVHVKENRRLTPHEYDRNIFHIEFDLGNSGLRYNIGEALGIHGQNAAEEVTQFIAEYGLNSDDIVEVPSREDPDKFEKRTVYQALLYNVDIFGRPPKRFYEALSEFASDEAEKKTLLTLSSAEGATEFKRRAEVDTITFADVLLEFGSARPKFDDIFRIVSPLKRREYSIASSQTVTPSSVALLIVVVDWIDSKGRDRFGNCSRFLSLLKPGSPVTVSVKPSVMKLPTKPEQPLIMAGLGTGLAPFRAFVQHRAWQKAQGMKIGAVLLYMGARHQREEYLYGEEWEAYQDAGVITLLGRAFSRDQPQKIYIQDRMRQTLDDIIKAYMTEGGSFYLCGPTWPVPDVTAVLEEAIGRDAQTRGRKIDTRKEIEKLKDDLRYVLEGQSSAASLANFLVY